MNIRNLTTLLMVSLFITACGGSNNTPDSHDGELTGIWRAEQINTLYLIHHNGNTISLNVCNEDSPFTLSQQGDSIGAGENPLFTINSSSQLEFSPGIALEGIKVNKISDQTQFNSGTVTINSSNISNVSTSENVCAYREADNIYNHIAAPYLDGYLLIILSIDEESTGEFDIPGEADVYFESDAFPGGEINSVAGTVNVTVYSAQRLTASFTFTTLDGNEYSGSVDVEI